MIKFLKGYLKISNTLDFYTTIIAVCFLLICFFGMLTQVFFRYILNEGLDWLLEIIRYSGTIFALLIFPNLIKRNDHIKIDIFEENIRNNVYLNNCLNIAILIFLIILGIKGIDIFEYGFRVKSTSLRMPMSYLYIFLPVSCLLSIIQLFNNWITGYMKNRNVILEKDIDILDFKEG